MDASAAISTMATSMTAISPAVSREPPTIALASTSTNAFCCAAYRLAAEARFRFPATGCAAGRDRFFVRRRCEARTRSLPPAHRPAASPEQASPIPMPQAMVEAAARELTASASTTSALTEPVPKASSEAEAVAAAPAVKEPAAEGPSASEPSAWRAAASALAFRAGESRTRGRTCRKAGFARLARSAPS